MALLEIRNVSKYFGGLAAITNFDMDVFDSEILGLIGPNGAGKSTLFNIIDGTFSPSKGSIGFRGGDITSLRPDQIARRGIGRTFQDSALFMQSSVFENVFIGFHMHYKQPLWRAFLHTGSVRVEENKFRNRVIEILDFMGLTSLQNEIAVNLPHGHLRILSICIALATNPALLLLDEPATGLNPEETLTLAKLIRQIRDSGTTVVIIEHHMQLVMSLCDRIVVLSYGKKIAEGLPCDVRQNTEVIRAYLGNEEVC